MIWNEGRDEEQVFNELPEAHELKEPDDAGIANTIFRGPATVACRAALMIVAVTISTTGFCL